MPDAKAIGSGPYAVSSYSKNQLVQLKANPHYTGPNKAKTGTITVKYYTEASNMKLDIQQGAIDIAWRSLAPTDIDSLNKTKGVKVLTGAGGELRYIVFDFKTMPGGSDARQAGGTPGHGVLDRPAGHRRQGLQGHVPAGVLDGAAGHRRCHRAVQGRVRDHPGQGQGQVDASGGRRQDARSR